MPYVIAFLMVSPLFLCWDKVAGSSFLMSHFGYKFLLPLDQLWGIFFHPILWYLLVLQWINFDVEANFLFPSGFLKRIMRQKIISRHPCIWVNDFDEESGDKRDFFAHTHRLHPPCRFLGLPLSHLFSICLSSLFSIFYVHSIVSVQMSLAVSLFPRLL